MLSVVLRALLHQLTVPQICPQPMQSGQLLNLKSLYSVSNWQLNGQTAPFEINFGLVHGKKFVIRKQNLLIRALWLDKEREDWEEEKERL